jgi:hypothetical protein
MIILSNSHAATIYTMPALSIWRVLQFLVDNVEGSKSIACGIRMAFGRRRQTHTAAVRTPSLPDAPKSLSTHWQPGRDIFDPLY